MSRAAYDMVLLMAILVSIILTAAYYTTMINSSHSQLGMCIRHYQDWR